MQAIQLFEEAAQTTDISWLLWVALGFFALMVITGWLVSRKKKPEEPPHDHHEETHNLH